MTAAPELQVMLAPRAAYARLAAAAGPGGAWVLLRRPLALAGLIGAFVSLTTTGSLTLRLWPSAALCWSLVPAVQLLGGAALVALGRRRPLPLSSALDLFFTAHGPWSLWILAVGAAATFTLPLGAAALSDNRPVLATAAVPLVWTIVILAGFCRSVLGLGRAQALLGTALYQLALWGLAIAYVLWTTR
ncbi:MAG TPA: hypothetical protein VF310_12620 [Vicinamibacteria bacterium]